MSERLWFDADRASTFVIPDDLDLPTGSLFLRTLTGEQRGFDADDLAPYAVDQPTAHKHLTAWIEGSYTRARQAFERGYGGSSTLPKSLTEGLGVDPARLGSDPEAAMDAVQKLTAGFLGWVGQQDGGDQVQGALQTLAGALESMAQSVREAAEPPAGEE